MIFICFCFYLLLCSQKIQIGIQLNKQISNFLIQPADDIFELFTRY